ncbi:hypothetical protein PGT21_018878 [Puccinia graminis f. sp. tritici]|uniref:Uncharacterized protein n=1 Tax=Puccinia graminis f. sp. tritici TaxID=56615 RepID=A0A5B0NUA1_PUCGR|nr:hypothetical protein PGT21_018878 [Puccinia graminis f. sp. tritici]KAA1092094.1 hypothetical protein PGTUg99_017838 [Puccinia graminis f. sp. tritici]
MALPIDSLVTSDSTKESYAESRIGQWKQHIKELMVWLGTLLASFVAPLLA